MKKTGEEKALAALIKSGWTKVVVCGVKDDQTRAIHNNLPPIEIIGLMECLKLLTVRVWSETPVPPAPQAGELDSREGE